MSNSLPEWSLYIPGDQPGTFRLLTLLTIRAATASAAFALARKRFPKTPGLAIGRTKDHRHEHLPH